MYYLLEFMSFFQKKNSYPSLFAWASCILPGTWRWKIRLFITNHEIAVLIILSSSPLKLTLLFILAGDCWPMNSYKSLAFKCYLQRIAAFDQRILHMCKERYFCREVFLDIFQLCGWIFGYMATLSTNKFWPRMDETFQAADVDVILVIPVVQTL